MSENSKEENNDLIKQSGTLDNMKRYFGIENQEDAYEFEKYIKKHTNLREQKDEGDNASSRQESSR
ncbi:MAG TPA: hypothetical protein VE130_08940 [Nitrososphaeraceae archaeon]|nr:hypothetical protein [Nitrososphaeraceae archaeon]